MEKKIPLLKRLEVVFFLLYFAILFVERIIDVVLSTLATNYTPNTTEILIYVMVGVSLVGFAVLLALKGKPLIAAVITGKEEHYEKVDFFWVSVMSGVILLSGMTHTPVTTLAAQFTSYGFLLIGILLRLIAYISGNGVHGIEKADYINRYIYFVAMSMSIPVIYYDVTLSGGVLLFNILQWIVMIGLVGLFTCMMISFYNNEGKVMLNLPSLLVVLVLDIPLLIVGWNSEHALPELADGFNFFLLVFPAIMIVSYIVGLFLKKK